jgi:hypothetical protein
MTLNLTPSALKVENELDAYLLANGYTSFQLVLKGSVNSDVPTDSVTDLIQFNQTDDTGVSHQI